MTQHEQGVKNVKEQLLCRLDTNATVAAERSRLTLKTSMLPQMPNTSLDFKRRLELLADEN